MIRTNESTVVVESGLTELEKRVSIIYLHDKKILFADFSGLSESDIVELLVIHGRLTIEQGDPIVYHMLNVHDTKITNKVKQCAKDLLSEYKVFGITVRSAAYGMSALQRIIAKAIKRDMYFAEDKHAALFWLTVEA